MITYPYFAISELECHGAECCDHQMLMDDEFMGHIIVLRKELGFPFVVPSAYRCPKHNQEVSSTGEMGPHTTGMAMDIAVSYEQAYRLLEAAILSGNFTGFGFNQKGSQRFIHLDNIPGPKRIWTY